MAGAKVPWLPEFQGVDMALEWPDWFHQVLSDAKGDLGITFNVDLSDYLKQGLFLTLGDFKRQNDTHLYLVRRFEELMEDLPLA